MTPLLEASYFECAQAARRSASNFHWCFRLLPPAKRRSMCALYAFARHSDDLVDNHQPVEQKQAALSAWRQQLLQAFEDGGDHGIFPALMDTVQRYAIPHSYLLDILTGVQMDLEPTQFTTFEDLRVYCQRVASSVGLACLHIWGFSDDAALPLAIDRGVAFQLTNILRDLREDLAQQRVYLPQEDLHRFACNAADLNREQPDQRVLSLLAYEIERAESYYRQSRELVRYLHRDGRRILRLMTATYWQLLRQIRQRPSVVFRQPIRLSFAARLSVVNSALLPWGAVRRGAL